MTAYEFLWLALGLIVLGPILVMIFVERILVPFVDKCRNGW